MILMMIYFLMIALFLLKKKTMMTCKIDHHVTLIYHVIDDHMSALVTLTLSMTRILVLKLIVDTCCTCYSEACNSCFYDDSPDDDGCCGNRDCNRVGSFHVPDSCPAIYFVGNWSYIWVDNSWTWGGSNFYCYFRCCNEVSLSSLSNLLYEDLHRSPYESDSRVLNSCCCLPCAT